MLLLFIDGVDDVGDINEFHGTFRDLTAERQMFRRLSTAIAATV